MPEYVDWDGLLALLPQGLRPRFERMLRRSLQREGQRKTGLAIPEAVHAQAIGAWRRQAVERGASKAAARRMRYEQLVRDPAFRALELELARRYWDAHPSARPSEAPRVEEMTFAEACEAYRALEPGLGTSSLGQVARDICDEAHRQASQLQVVYEEVTTCVCDYLRTEELTRCASLPRREGRAHRRTQDRRRDRDFSLSGLSTEQEIHELVRSVRLVEGVLTRLYGHDGVTAMLRDRTLVALEGDPSVRALHDLLKYLFDDPSPLRRIMHGIAREDVRRLRTRLGDGALEGRVVESLLQNRIYGAEFRWSVELKLRVRENVPETPMEAYPLARTMRRHFVVHVGPTNSGKTHDALRALAGASSGAYLGPLRLLAYEQFQWLNREGCPCTLLTGEEMSEVAGARHVSSTIEMADFHQGIEVAVIDEAQMMTDPERGQHWTSAILGIPAAEVHVCCAPHAASIVCDLVRLCEDDCEVVRHERLVPLLPDSGDFSFPEGVRKGDALIVFSRRSVHRVAEVVAVAGHRPSLVYGALPHDVRHEEARRFDEGETDVVVATDAIGMGMNLPIRRIVFVEQEKFDGRSTRMLRPEEVQQIAGRAGRYGRYDTGLYQSTRLRSRIIRLYKRRVAEIRSIPVGIPEDIALVRGAKLSEAIMQWAAIEQPEPFVRVDVTRELSLIADVETRIESGSMAGDLTDTDTKLKVLALATMAFDERDRVLRAVWSRMVDAELSGCEAELPVPEGPVEGESLESLEAGYRYCDLLYGYARTFGHPKNVGLLTERRERISRAIMRLLAEGSLGDE